MNNSNIFQGFFLLTLTLGFSLFLSSCDTTKKATETTIEEAPDDAASFMASAAQHQFQAEWFKGNAQLSYDDGNMSVGATSSIKMQKDKVVLMTVKKLGFELSRVKITPDSVYILDRFNNQYIIEPLSYIEDNFGLPADLGMIQQIFLGNPVFLATNNLKGDLKDGVYRLSASSDNARNDFWFNMPGYTMNRMEVGQESKNRSLTINLGDYKDVGSNRDFSYLRNISVKSAETGTAQIDIEFSKIEINVPVEIKFSIPPRYTRASY